MHNNQTHHFWSLWPSSEKGCGNPQAAASQSGLWSYHTQGAGDVTRQCPSQLSRDFQPGQLSVAIGRSIASPQLQEGHGHAAWSSGHLILWAPQWKHKRGYMLLLWRGTHSRQCLACKHIAPQHASTIHLHPKDSIRTFFRNQMANHIMWTHNKYNLTQLSSHHSHVIKAQYNAISL